MRPAGEAEPPSGVRLAASATKLSEDMRGLVVVCGSHGGLYPGWLAAKAGLRGVILSDAGVGKDGAGIASLDFLDRIGMPAATLSSMLCRIGDPRDMIGRGRVSHLNSAAADLGVRAGQGAAEAAALMTRAALAEEAPRQAVGEGRVVLPGAGRRVVLIDSAALVRPEDQGCVVVSGSHGGLVGGDPAMALQVDAFAAAFNDAGVGPDEAGLSRLPALDARGIAAFTVSAASARIGEARSTLEDGLVSHYNRRAEELGASKGLAARALVERLARL